MRGLNPAPGTGHGSRLDGRELEAAVRIGADAAVAPERGIDGLRLRVLGVGVAAIGVRLSELEHRVGHTLAVAVKDPPAHADALAGHAAGREIVAQ